MESILLTLDVACMVLLVFAVVRVHRSGNENDLGLFRFRGAGRRKQPGPPGGP